MITFLRQKLLVRCNYHSSLITRRKRALIATDYDTKKSAPPKPTGVVLPENETSFHAESSSESKTEECLEMNSQVAKPPEPEVQSIPSVLLKGDKPKDSVEKLGTRSGPPAKSRRSTRWENLMAVAAQTKSKSK
jgi:hypothetical protein